MTLPELRASPKAFLTPAEIAPVLGCTPYSINLQAKADPSALGFAVCVTGTRVRTPRLAFLRWLTYGNAPITNEEATAP